MTGLPHHTRRRWARLGIFVLFALVSLGLAWALWRSDDGAGEQLLAVAGLFVSVAALAVSAVTLLPPMSAPRDAAELADFLATTVREQWEEEVTARRLRDPRVIPLTWSATTRPVTGPPEDVVGSIDARVLRLSLDGRLEGGFDTAARQLAEGFTRVASRRLVVLGEPGAGKTVLAVMLTLGLLAVREPRAPVPVLLSVSTWDPVTEPLNDWIVRSLATAYYGGQPDLPRRLLDRRLLLPVLDGLDEMPETARRGAVRAVNDACGDGRGVVVTCRSAEYQDVIEGGSPVLRRAPVVEVAPVPVPEVLGYLREVNWPPGVDWAPVYARLEAHPGGPLAGALSTPLALSLARIVYRAQDRDPTELLGFDSRHALEDHLVDQSITAAYAPQPDSHPSTRDDQKRRAERAERYLTYLATYLHRHRERDLAWWLMSSRLLSRWTGIVLGIAVGLLAVLAVTATINLIGRGAGERFADSIGSAVGEILLLKSEAGVLFANSIAGVAGGILTMLTWYGAPDRTPGRLLLSRRGLLGRLCRGVRTGLRLAAFLVLPVMLTVAIAITLAGWTPAALVTYCQVVAWETAAVVAVSLAFGVHGSLDAPPERSMGASPLGLLRQDRTSSLVGALAAGVVLAALLNLLVILGTFAAFVTFLMLTRGARDIVPSGTLAKIAGEHDIFSTPLHALAFTLLPGIAFAVLILLTRAWTRFAVLRLVLAARGVLPWRLTRFLSDARDRQLLRQSAGVYQFRHIRLQERLAARPAVRPPVSRAWRARRRRVLSMTVAVALGASWLGLHAGLTPDTSSPLLITGQVEAMMFAPRSQHTLIVLDDKGTVRGWDTRNGRQRRSLTVRLPTIKHSKPLYTFHDWESSEPVPWVLAPAVDGLLVLPSLVSSAVQQPVTLPWDSSPRDRAALLKGMGPLAQKRVKAEVLALSPDGSYAVTVGVSGDTRQDRVVVRDTRTGMRRGSPLVLVTDKIEPANLPLLSANGARLVVNFDTAWPNPDPKREGLNSLETGSGKKRCNTGRPVEQVAMDVAGTRMATTEGRTAHVYDGNCRELCSFPVIIGASSEVEALALSDDGSMLATAEGGTVRVWDLPRGQRRS